MDPYSASERLRQDDGGTATQPHRHPAPRQEVSIDQSADFRVGVREWPAAQQGLFGVVRQLRPQHHANGRPQPKKTQNRHILPLHELAIILQLPERRSPSRLTYRVHLEQQVR